MKERFLMNRDLKKKNTGFTLIELLVVIAIIGILAAIVIASVSRVRASARDAKRVAALRTVDTAMGLWVSNKSYIPDPAGRQVADVAAQSDPEALDVACNTTNPIAGLPALTPCLAMKSSSPTFIGAPGTGFATNNFVSTTIKDPTDPGCFILYVTDGVDYETMVVLENDSARMQNDGGNEPLAYERGSNTRLAGTWTDLGVTPCVGGGGGSPPPPPSSLPSGLISSYNFNGNANDSSGNGYNGTLNGGATVSVASMSGYGNALSLDGINANVSFGGGVPMPGIGSGTWTAWINRNDVPNRDVAILSKSDDNGSDGWTVSIRNSDKLCFDGVYNNGNVRRCTAQPGNGTWYYLAVTWSGTGAIGDPATGVKIYIGSSVSSPTEVSLPSYNNVQDSCNGNLVGCTHNSDVIHSLYIGDDEWTALNRFKGLLDNVRIYNRVLSPVELATDKDYLD